MYHDRQATQAASVAGASFVLGVFSRNLELNGGPGSQVAGCGFRVTLGHYLPESVKCLVGQYA
jgi:hypothetical protein